MTLSPFPPQELAKLVLGYLAEEQLMTAYDEFLQGSPYLDALENEHDHVFLTPLRHIVAEYRALKIYVGTCKPFALRQRLIGCANLLEAIKLLVNLVDTNKINCQEHRANQLGYDSVNTKAYSRVKSVCDVCSSLNRTNCACHILSKSNSSVDATLLEDLPGHHRRKKHVKVSDKDTTLSSVTSNEQLPLSSKNLEESTSENLDQDVVLVGSETLQRRDNDFYSDHQKRNIHPVRKEYSNASKKSDHILTTLSNVSHSSQHNSMSSGHGDPHSPAIGTFQEFAAEVGGKNTVPDSRPSDPLDSVIPVTPNGDSTRKGASGNDTTNKKGVTRAHILLKVENKKNSTPSQTNSAAIKLTTSDPQQSHSSTKPAEQKITILSDIQVDKGFVQSDDGGGGGIRPPTVLRHAFNPRTLHSVLINGTRVFTRELVPGAPSYTPDEIMAMPTIILMPAPSTAAGQPKNSNNPPKTTQTSSVTPKTMSSAAPSLGPLLIDVGSSDSAKSQVEFPKIESTVKPQTQSDISKSKELELKNERDTLTFEVNELNSEGDKLTAKALELSNEGDTLTAKAAEFKNATVPKDAEASNKSTPVTVALPRKSSSTPRRSSHVRVLDFTTPRRILSEPIPEDLPFALDATTTATQHPVEVTVSKNPILYTYANPKKASNTDESTIFKLDSVSKNEECAIATQSIQKIITVKKSDWDADLRALAVANVKLDAPKQKEKSSRRKKGSENRRDVQKSQEKKKSKKKSNISKSTTKIKLKSLKALEDLDDIVEPSVLTPVAVKPTINVITEHDWGTIAAPNDPDKNKPNSDDETDTPEMDRLSLQNALGAKLNISDLLETPYKQALYDIQMETPKFLGPDLPGDPVSDIKIMNIPTPRFLNTPKPPQATPSSYSSRPTDYSSGGSYYKPDDQDYIDVGYPVPPPKETPPASDDVCKSKCKDKVLKSSRPVRKCTKNVSYVNSPNIKAKEDDKAGESGSNERAQPTKDLKCKTPKTEAKRKSIGIKKRKTPVKKETPKSFMKIKPRRLTPVKDSGRKSKQSGTPGRKKTVNKNKIASVTLAVASAPPKSRRKSSTPRKLHRTKQFQSESSGHDSPEMVETKNVPTRASCGSVESDNDTEAPPLRWSDEGTQDVALTDTQIKPTEDKQHATTSNEPRLSSVNDTEDITNIQKYLAESEPIKYVSESRETSLHIDLVRRGFDVETAKIIERDLLDTPPYPKENAVTRNVEHLVPEASKDNKVESAIGEKGQSVSSTSVNVDVDVDEEDEIELSVHDCNEDTENYIVCHHDDNKDVPRRTPEKLKDKFSIEVFIAEDVAIRLRATPLTFLIDESPKDDEEKLEYNRETEMAVSSISGMVKLYTPLKEQRAQYYEIFDSTLTSLDTPLKVDTPRRDPEMTVTEIVLEEIEVKNKAETKTRKRALSGNASENSTTCENKRSKPDPQYLLNPPNIKNIDIETVLCKLHGP